MGYRVGNEYPSPHRTPTQVIHARQTQIQRPLGYSG